MTENCKICEEIEKWNVIVKLDKIGKYNVKPWKLIKIVKKWKKSYKLRKGRKNSDRIVKSKMEMVKFGKNLF